MDKTNTINGTRASNVVYAKLMARVSMSPANQSRIRAFG